MTIWLQKRLAIWMGVSLLGGALVWNGGASRAQGYVDYGLSRLNIEDNKPRTKLTRDKAAQEFSLFLDGGLQLSGPPTDFRRIRDAISPKSERELDFKFRPLFWAMSSQWKQINRSVKVQSQGDKTATVLMEADSTPPARPLILVEEDGGWGVDLVETYAKWNGLEGVAKAEAIYKLTGVVLEELPRSEERTRNGCQSNLKQVGLGIAQYVQDYDEKYPLAKPWMDIVYPYIKSEAVYTCPSLPKGKRFGYAYNSKLSNKYIGILPNTSKTISVYETSILKHNVYGAGENPAFRHLDGANYAFADGHVKWFAKTQIPSFKLKP